MPKVSPEQRARMNAARLKSYATHPVARLAKVLKTNRSALIAKLAYHEFKANGKTSMPDLVAAVRDRCGVTFTAAMLKRLDLAEPAEGAEPARQAAANKPDRMRLITLARLKRLARERIAADTYGELETAVLDFVTMERGKP